jgi:hypothetical protein
MSLEKPGPDRRRRDGWLRHGQQWNKSASGEQANSGRFCLTRICVPRQFFGAATCLGNGPDFTIIAVADQQKIRIATFPGFVLKFTLPFLWLMLLAVRLIFFHG